MKNLSLTLSLTALAASLALSGCGDEAKKKDLGNLSDNEKSAVAKLDGSWSATGLCDGTKFQENLKSLEVEYSGAEVTTTIKFKAGDKDCESVSTAKISKISATEYTTTENKETKNTCKDPNAPADTGQAPDDTVAYAFAKDGTLQITAQLDQGTTCIAFKK